MVPRCPTSACTRHQYSNRPGFVNVRLKDDGNFPALPGGNSRPEFT